MTDDELDAAIRRAWFAHKELNPAWHSPTVFIGEWVRIAYRAGYVRGVTECRADAEDDNKHHEESYFRV